MFRILYGRRRGRSKRKEARFEEVGGIGGGVGDVRVRRLTRDGEHRIGRGSHRFDHGLCRIRQSDGARKLDPRSRRSGYGNGPLRTPPRSSPVKEGSWTTTVATGAWWLRTNLARAREGLLPPAGLRSFRAPGADFPRGAAPGLRRRDLHRPRCRKARPTWRPKGSSETPCPIGAPGAP